MLNRLRHRFTAVIMFVAVISIVALLSINISTTKKTLEQQSIHSLETLLDSTGFMFIPGETIQSLYFIVDISQDGAVSLERSDYYTIDDDMLLDIVSSAYYSANTTGTVEDYSLRFMSKTQFGFTRIAFVDTSVEQNTVKNMCFTSLIIGIVAIGVFFVFSVLVSKAIVKPTAMAWDSQKQFVADASHELKTPLTVIMANSELLEQSNSIVDPDDKRHIVNILDEGARMKLLLENLLEQARADDCSRKYQNSGDKIDLSYLTEECALSFEPVLFENGKTIKTDICQNVYVKGSYDRLRRVIAILIDNANKYSDNNSEIAVELYEDKKNAVLKVSDFGEPLSQENIDKIFLRFYRADDARSHNGSYGLGLSIAKSIAESHGGTIRVECKGRLSAFLLNLPLLKE